MLVKDLVYLGGLFFAIISVIFLICSIKTKNLIVCKNISIVSVVYIIYVFFLVAIIPFSLQLSVGLEMLLFYLMAIIAGIIYIISFIICCIKKKKLVDCDNFRKNKNVKLLLLLLPIVIFICVFLKEIYLLNSSDLMLFYFDSGNGGIGDGERFGYIIKEDKCDEISLGVGLDGFLIDRFLFNSINNLQQYGYSISYDVNSLYGYNINNYKYLSEYELRELDYSLFRNVLMDVKNRYSFVDEVYLFYLKGDEEKYFIVEVDLLEKSLIYKEDKFLYVIDKIEVPGDLKNVISVDRD